jgi:branched-chain amino acid transport system substrate-binding protein
MGRRLKVLVATALVLVVGAVIASAATGAKSADPGVTSNSVLFGSAFPLTGPAAAYGTIARAEEAYFKWYNDTRGGVFKRKINFKYLDDGYVPAQALQVMRQLVEQDGIFAAFQTLGTEVNLAVRDYLKQRGVPNLFVATGASFWGTQHSQYPSMIGYAPDYVSESKLYGTFIRTKVPQAKIGILAQNDDYGSDYIRGLKLGLGNQANKIVEIQRYELTDTDLSGYVSKLKASGANLFMDIGTPAFSIRMLVAAARLGWNPITFVNGVAAPNLYMRAAAAAGASSLVNGAYSTSYGKDPSDPRWANDPAIKAYKEILGKYCATCNPNDAFNLYGFGVGDVLIRAMIKAGKNLTRASLVKASMNLNIRKPPYGLPGVNVTTSDKCKDYFPISVLYLARYTDGRFVEFGKPFDGRPQPKGKKC